MRTFQRTMAFATVLVVGVGPTLSAQQFVPHIGYVYPAGGQQGSSFEVTVGGQYLDGVTGAFITGGGVQATVVEHIKPINQQQFNKLRDELKELMAKKAAAVKAGWKPGVEDSTPSQGRATWTPEEENKIAEIKKKMATFVRRPSSPAIVENVILRIAIASDATPGEREIRLATPTGLTNPLVFCVGQLPEVSEKPARLGAGFEPDMGWRRLRRGEGPAPEPEIIVPIKLPAIVNGQMIPRGSDLARFQFQQGQQFTPGDVDRYRFQAYKGQEIVIAVKARALIPYLADAVPGWFQATLTLYDANGKELAYEDDFRFHPDPVLHYKIPADGEYVMEIKDAIYRGREDFVYRIAIGELPFITSIFPLGGPAGSVTSVELTGWNLPVQKLTVDARSKGPGICPITVRRGDLISNSVPYAVDTLPECLEQEPNNEASQAQKVPLPIIVNGRIGMPGDKDVFAFEGRAGQEVVAEVSARRLDSPLDSILRLTDPSGKQLAFNDDSEDKGSGLNTHHADSYVRATLPTDGTYYLYLGEAARQGGPQFGYRLRISPPRPDFALRVVPSSVSLRGNMAAPLTVYALRKDGFSGAIKLALKDAPGFTLTGAEIPANEEKMRITLTAPPSPTKEPVRIRLEGCAVIEGREVVRSAIPAEDMMQAFFYRHLVPSEDLEVAISDRWAPKAPIRIITAAPVKIPAGGAARVQVGVPSKISFGHVQFELNEPPEGINLEKAAPVGYWMEMVFRADANKVKPGQKGNLIVSMLLVPKNPAAVKGGPAGVSRRAAIGVLPAIPYEVIQP